MVERTILHYRIVEPLARDRSTDVVLAEDTALGRRVTLALVDAAALPDRDARERVVRRARTALRLSHPNIAAVLAVEETAQHVVIAMEHVEGESLRALVRRGEVGIPRALDVAAQVLAALANAHETAVVHRRITADAIVVARDGRVKLLGFGPPGGLAAGRPTPLEAAAALSPEQVRGQAVDQRSDLFSFGVVLYEMIAGRSPFRGKDEAAVRRAILEDEPDPLPDRRLYAVVTRALAKDPNARYQSAVGMQADLARAAAQTRGS